MILKAKYVRHEADLQEERIIFEATSDGDIGDHIVLRAQSSGTGVHGGGLDAYWVPNKSVNSGDLVVLYTKKGENSHKKWKDGSRTWYLYWGRESASWQSPFVPVLMQIEYWATVGLEEKEREVLESEPGTGGGDAG